MHVSFCGYAQGRHINDAQVLREIAREAKLIDPDRVADDPHCCEDVVRLDALSYKFFFGVNPRLLPTEIAANRF